MPYLNTIRDLDRLVLGWGIDKQSVSQENGIISLLLMSETECHFESQCIEAIVKALGKRPFTSKWACYMFTNGILSLRSILWLATSYFAETKVWLYHCPTPKFRFFPDAYQMVSILQLGIVFLSQIFCPHIPL